MEPLTLDQIHAAGPCKSGWAKLLAGLGYTGGRYDSARQITIGDVAAINGIDDALWCIKFVDDPRLRVRAIMPAVDRAAKHSTDARVHNCIAALHKWLDGDEHADLLAAARAGSWAAARAARAGSWAAASAARATSWAAEDGALAAWAAARAARVVVRVALAASWIARAAEGASGAAWAVAGAAGTKAEVARMAERAAQVNDLIALFGRSP